MEGGLQLDSLPISGELGTLGRVEIGTEVKRMKDGQSTAQRCVEIANFFVARVVDPDFRETKNTSFSSVDSGSITLAYYQH